MKQTAAACLFLSIATVAPLSQAQTAPATGSSSVTLYGVIDMAVRSTTHAAADGGDKLEVTNGTFNGSRFGLRGEESLGAGNTAYFLLENGFSPDTGSTAGFGNRLFGRQAYVGLKGTWGSLQAGRDTTLGYDTVSVFDAVSPMNINFQIQMHAILVGDRFDNSIKYRTQSGPFSLGLQTALGEKSGESQAGRSWAGNVVYADGPWSASAVYESMTDGRGVESRVFAAGGALQTERGKFTAGYITRRTGAGFDWIASTSNVGIAGAIENLSNVGNTVRRDDDLVTLSMNHALTESWKLYAGFMHGKARDVAPNQDGTRQTLYGIADYSLSKRSDVYLGGDFNRVRGALVAQGLFGNGIGNNQKTMLGLSMGLRHRF